jgi:4-aminobutyrate--pyruvate transaminase
LERLQTLTDLEVVGDVRGLGLMAAVELVADRETRAPLQAGERVRRAMQERGVILRARGDVLMVAPPLIISPSEIDRVVETLRASIEEVAGR